MSKVRLIAISRPVDGSSPEDLIAYCARVSNPKSQEAGTGNGRLIRYLINHQHWSPFEMVFLTIEIKTTRDIADEPSQTLVGHWQGHQQPEVHSYRWSDAMLQKHPPASPASPAPTVQAKWFKGGAEGHGRFGITFSKFIGKISLFIFFSFL